MQKLGGLLPSLLAASPRYEVLYRENALFKVDFFFFFLRSERFLKVFIKRR